MSAVEVSEETRFKSMHVCLSSEHQHLMRISTCLIPQNLLRSHPPNQVLSSLQALTSRQQVALEEKIAALNVERDVSALG